MHPFCFSFSGGPVESEYIENETTNEELFISYVEPDEDDNGMPVLIKRSAKKKEDSPETEWTFAIFDCLI